MRLTSRLMSWITRNRTRSEAPADDHDYERRLMLAQERQRDTLRRVARLEAEVGVYRREGVGRRHSRRRRWTDG